MEVVYVTYAQAQKLIPIMEHIAKNHEWKEARESAKRILPDLKMVRGDISYEPLSGRQIFLRSELDRDFLMDSLRAIEE